MTLLERLGGSKHSSLLGPFVSYAEFDVRRIRYLMLGLVQILFGNRLAAPITHSFNLLNGWIAMSVMPIFEGNG